MQTLPELKKLDILLYDVDSIFTSPQGYLVDLAIRFKTWSEVAHLEMYWQAGLSFASRGEGVNFYPFRRDGLKYVLRPKFVDEVKAGAYANSVIGQKYDWLGLLCFTLAVKRGSPDRQFCSELGCNTTRAAGCELFSADWSADKVAPGSFLMLPNTTTIYKG